MILCDTGIFVGAIDATDKQHLVCADVMHATRQRLITTWPCITEAMYLLGMKAGRPGQETLSGYIEKGVVVLHQGTQEEAKRACDLMRQYADTPMDFADASLVVMAESLGITRILTLDSHFYAYRIDGKTPFNILPRSL